MNNNENFKIINYANRIFKCYKTGEVYRLNPNGDFKQIGLVPHETSCSSNKCYYRTSIAINNHQQEIKIHRLIAKAFLGLNIENKKDVIDHIDGNGLNNNLSNLRICTQQENSRNNKSIKGVQITPKGFFRVDITTENNKRKRKQFRTHWEALQYRHLMEIEHGYLSRAKGIAYD